MITPVNPLRTRLIHISPSYWAIYCSFEIILKLCTVYWIGIKIQCSIRIHCFKKHSVRCELYFLKYLIPQGSSGSKRSARVKNERKRESPYYERDCFTQVTCNMNAKRPDMERKSMNSGKASGGFRVEGARGKPKKGAFWWRHHLRYDAWVTLRY